MKNVYFFCMLTILISIKQTYSSLLSDSPVRIETKILTQAQDRIAGDTIFVVLKISGTNDSIVHGSYCFNNVICQDTLGKGNKPAPIVVFNSDNKIDTINEFPSTTHSARLCLNDGIDTIKIVLYNAPVSPDSVHKLFIHLDSMLVLSTDPFHLYPGNVKSLDIEIANGSSVPDTIELNAPNDSRMFYAAGFDRYGNRIPGWMPCFWSTSGDLHPANWQSVGQIYYETGSVAINETGVLTASTIDPDTLAEIKDQVLIKINGPAINLTQALTRDIDGNGYLDHIELHFALPVTLPANFSFTGLSIISGASLFTASGIENNTGRTDSVWLIKINEVQNGIPQTAWKPYIKFDGDNNHSIAGANKVQCQDGAGPVVWSVENNRRDKDPADDVVTVILSEPVMRSNGSSLTLIDTPSMVFSVWQKNTNDTFVRVDKFLEGINAFMGITTTIKDPRQSVVSFKMINGNDLTSQYYISVNTDKMFITDNAGGNNFPNLNNQRVRVLVTPQITEVDVDTLGQNRTSTVTSSTGNGCGCGTGTGLAFIPPIFMKARYHLRKRIKKNKNIE